MDTHTPADNHAQEQPVSYGLLLQKLDDLADGELTRLIAAAGALAASRKGEPLYAYLYALASAARQAHDATAAARAEPAT